MTRTPEGKYTWVRRLSKGSYAYKFYDQARDRWFEDPRNPLHKWVDGERNSRLVVQDCSEPYLRLMHQPEVEGAGTAAGATITFSVQYVDGVEQAGMGPSGIVATRNGVPVSVTSGPQGVATLRDTGLAPGKYTYKFEAVDGKGRRARLHVPVWVETRSFDWRDAVLYFAMTDRFFDGDPSNNAPVAGVDPKLNWHGGDFAGLRAKLEEGYFDALGVNALWISSLSQNTGGAWPGEGDRPTTGYHSYWPISTGWTDDLPLGGVVPVDPHFGTLDEFKAFVEAAHRRGIRVLVDLVANHVHEEHPLYAMHKNDVPPWFSFPAEGCKETNWTKPITCWFAPYLPDLDYRTEAVMDMMTRHVSWLVTETDVDGFRLDAVKHMIDDFSYAIRATVNRHLRYARHRFYMVGETFTGEDGVDLLKHYIGPDKLDGQFDFPLYWQVTATLLREERDLGSLAAMVKWNDTVYGDAIMSTFLGNHDVCRALSHAAGAFADMWCNDGKTIGWTAPPALPSNDEPFERLRLAWTFLMTSPGIPLIYYGDELGMEGAGDPDNRKPMRFGTELTPAQQATLEHVRRLGRLRAEHPAVRRGTRVHVHQSSDGLFWAYAMATRDDTVLVLLNRTPTSRSEKLDVARFGWPDGTMLKDMLTEKTFAVSHGQVSVTVDGRTSSILVPQN